MCSIREVQLLTVHFYLFRDIFNCKKFCHLFRICVLIGRYNFLQLTFSYTEENMPFSKHFQFLNRKNLHEKSIITLYMSLLIYFRRFGVSGKIRVRNFKDQVRLPVRAWKEVNRRRASKAVGKARAWRYRRR